MGFPLNSKIGVALANQRMVRFTHRLCEGSTYFINQEEFGKCLDTSTHPQEKFKCCASNIARFIRNHNSEAADTIG